MSEDIDQLVNEIEEDLKQEKYMKLWKKYGNIVIAVFLVVVAGVGGHTFYDQYEAKKRNETSDIFLDGMEAVSKGEPIRAQGVLDEVAAGSHAGYKMLAQFQKAALLVEEGGEAPLTEARVIYKDIASNTKYPKRFRELAELRVIAMKDTDRTEETLRSTLAKLEPFTKEGRPWRYSAKELKASILMELDDNVAAAEVMADLIRDAKTPEGVKSRAQIVSQTLASTIEKNIEE